MGGRRAGKGGGEAPKCHEEPQATALVQGEGKGTQEGGAGAAAAPHPLAGTGILPGVSLQGAGCQGCRKVMMMSTPLHLHLWKKGKKQGKGAKVWLQLQASSGEKKQFPLTKKRKKETSGWMKKKKNTPPGDEGHPW